MTPEFTPTAENIKNQQRFVSLRVILWMVCLGLAAIRSTNHTKLHKEHEKEFLCKAARAYD